MNLLLDTHILIWWLSDDPALSKVAKRALYEENNIVFVSAVSAFEVTTKHRIGKLPEAAVLAAHFEAIVEDEGFKTLSISVRHATLAGGLSHAHKDPFDRLLIAQALFESMSLISNEATFDSFGVSRLW